MREEPLPFQRTPLVLDGAAEIAFDLQQLVQAEVRRLRIRLDRERACMKERASSTRPKRKSRPAFPTSAADQLAARVSAPTRRLDQRFAACAQLVERHREIVV